MKYLFFITLIITSEIQAKSYQLKELIELAKVHPEVKIESYEVEKAKTLFERIKGETNPKLSILSGLGPNKSISGNAITTTQSSRIDTITYMGKIDLKIPVFTFNREKDLTSAANGNLQIKELDVKKKELEIIKKVKEYYYGLQYASSLNDYASSTIKDLDDIIKEMKERKSQKRSDEDLNKLSLFRSLAQVKKFEIEKGMAQGILGLKYITQTQDPTIDQDWIEFNKKEISALDNLLTELPESNIDLKKANIGIDAKTSFLISEKKSQFPVFGFFSSFDWKETPKTTRQISKFANDSYNTSDFSVGLGFIWEIDFGIKSSNVSAALIDLESIKAQKSFAQKNLPIKIEKIYLDLTLAEKKATELEKTYKMSKKLLNNIITGVALGITPAKDIIESYTLKAEIYQQFVEATYNYEMKLAELSFEVGTELDPDLK